MSDTVVAKRRGRPRRTDIDTGKVCQDYRDETIPVAQILSTHGIDAMMLYRILDRQGVELRVNLQPITGRDLGDETQGAA